MEQGAEFVSKRTGRSMDFEDDYSSGLHDGWTTRDTIRRKYLSSEWTGQWMDTDC